MLRITYFIHRSTKAQTQPVAVSYFYSKKEADKQLLALNRRGDGIYFIKPRIQMQKPDSRETFMFLAWQCLDIPVAYYDNDGTRRIDRPEHFSRLDRIDARIKSAVDYIKNNPSYSPDPKFWEFFCLVRSWRATANELFLALVRDDQKSRMRVKQLQQQRNLLEKGIKYHIIDYAESNKK